MHRQDRSVGVRMLSRGWYRTRWGSLDQRIGARPCLHGFVRLARSWLRLCWFAYAFDGCLRGDLIGLPKPAAQTLRLAEGSTSEDAGVDVLARPRRRLVIKRAASFVPKHVRGNTLSGPSLARLISTALLAGSGSAPAYAPPVGREPICLRVPHVSCPWPRTESLRVAFSRSDPSAWAGVGG